MCSGYAQVKTLNITGYKNVNYNLQLIRESNKGFNFVGV